MGKILVINPGSTSTKIALFDDAVELCQQTLRHSTEELSVFSSIGEQLDFRKEQVMRFLTRQGVDVGELAAVIGRGGLVKPLSSGIYKVRGELLEDLASMRYGAHASNLGGLIAHELVKDKDIKAYIADPVVVDEMDELARITGIPSIRRRSIFHALNQKSIARRYAAEHDAVYEELNLIIAHLGGGISVGAHRKGRVVDVNNALDGDGPFSPERAGSLPAGQFAEYVVDAQDTVKVKSALTGGGGLTAWLGTNDVRECLERIGEGDERTRLVVDSMCYNISKSIGAMAAVLEGRVDSVILTGGIAHNRYITDMISAKVGFIAPLEVYPGEDEMLALAENMVRLLNGETTLGEY